MTLAPGHRSELHASGLSDDTIARAGCYSATDPGVRDLLGFGAGSGLVFPYPELNGGGPCARVKLDNTPPDGKRYRSPKGRPNRLYIPPLLDRAVLTNAQTPLWITEGEKKALKACQEGLPCIAVPGVWSWKTRDSRDKSVAIPDLEHIAWRGRSVFVVYDSDVATNPKVRLAEHGLAAELQRRGASVKAVRLPGGPTGSKVGLDDYLLTHSVEALCALEPVEILDPATELGEPEHVRQGDEHRIAWSAQGVVLTLTGFREHSEGVAAEIAVALRGQEIHWSKLNLASTASREALVKKLTTHAAKVPWRAIVERSCRLCVEATRAGNPAVAVIPRVRTGPRHLLDPIAPIEETTVLAGDGGAGKSYLVTAFALAIACNAPLPGGIQPGIRGPVLYLDWESTEEEFAERIWFLSNGLGCRVQGLHYKPMVAALAAELPAVKAEIARVGAVAVVIDSLAPACGSEPEGADAAVRTMTALRALGPASRLVVAHVSKAAADGQGPARPFGSVFIQNLARSVWEVRRSDEDEGDDLLLGLYHRKVNTGRRHRPLALRLHFTGAGITLHEADLSERADLATRLPLRQRVTRRLEQVPGLTAAELAEALDEDEASVLRTLGRLVERGIVRKVNETKPFRWGRVITA